MEELVKSPLDPEGGICTRESCGRPAVWGIINKHGENVYHCERHQEIVHLYGQQDWLIGEIAMVDLWLTQVYRDNGETLLKVDEIDLGPLSSALQLAYDLTQKEIDSKENYLREVSKDMEDEAIAHYVESQIEDR